MPPIPSTPSVSTWMRLEPRSRNAAMETSLQARIDDPLWLLARQWQLGEFQGEDNGSPIIVRWRGGVARLARYQPGVLRPNSRVNAQPYDAAVPLETLVERETVRPASDADALPERLRLAAEAGRHFLRMLAAQPNVADYGAAFTRQYAFPPLSDEQRAAFDARAVAFCQVMAGRVPDGRKLYEAFQVTEAGEVVVAPELEIAASDVAEVQVTARQWRAWYESLFSEPQTGVAPTWNPERMEHAFSVGARLSDGERVLTAQEYAGGRLDWHDFDANPEVTLGGRNDAAPANVTRTVIPAPLSFRGMAAARFWELEDAVVNLDAVEAAPTDLVRMLLVEFALAYGNDWFVLPIELEVDRCARRSPSSSPTRSGSARSSAPMAVGRLRARRSGGCFSCRTPGRASSPRRTRTHFFFRPRWQRRSTASQSKRCSF